MNHLRHAPLDWPNVSHRVAGGPRAARTILNYVNSQFDPAVTWADAAEAIRAWDGAFAIKGILSAADAKRAAAEGASAVIVSNHGGRQLDGCAAPVDRLAEIVEAVGGELEVILDGGVRRGSHVLKALALGAKACMIGRAGLWGLAAGGQAGVTRALALLRREIERDLALVGCRDIGNLSGDFVRRRGA